MTAIIAGNNHSLTAGPGGAGRTVMAGCTIRTQNGGQYRLRRNVYLLIHDGQARLMDLRRGRFFALDVIGTQMLSLALERGSSALVSHIAQEYDAEPEQVRGDWAQLSRELRREGLLEIAPESFRSRVVLGRVRLMVLLTLAWLCFRLFGWAGTVRLWRRTIRPVADTRLARASQEVVEAVGQAVQDAAAGHVLNTECKERSLVAWHILCEQFGLPAEIVIGAVPYPFQAHAWVECGPWTITDERANCNAYIPFARFT